MSASASNTQPEGTTPQTRYRKITACLRCRDRKKKCDRKLPVCINCEKEKKECVYANDSQQLKEHKQKLHNLNRSFASRLANGDRAQGIPTPYTHILDCSLTDFALENPELNPLIVTDPAYEEDADDDSADLGIKCGKLRISDRIGGFVRPKAVEEVCSHVFDTEHDCSDSLADHLYFGIIRCQKPWLTSSIHNFRPSLLSSRFVACRIHGSWSVLLGSSFRNLLAVKDWRWTDWHFTRSHSSKRTPPSILDMRPSYCKAVT